MRIIAGRFRGRPIRAPKGSTTRPTTDRVREALFSILGRLDGLSVVDCYAGTGALGLEALSRGARHALLIEADRKACDAIRDNVQRLGLHRDELTLIASPLERSTTRIQSLAPFDLVLADPPWPIAEAAAERVGALFAPWLARDGRLVLGHPTRRPLVLPSELGFHCIDQRHWGDSAMSFFQRQSGPRANNESTSAEESATS